MSLSRMFGFANRVASLVLIALIVVGLMGARTFTNEKKSLGQMFTALFAVGDGTAYKDIRTVTAQAISGNTSLAITVPGIDSTWKCTGISWTNVGPTAGKAFGRVVTSANTVTPTFTDPATTGTMALTLVKF